MNMIDEAKRFAEKFGTTLQTYDLCHSRVFTYSSGKPKMRFVRLGPRATRKPKTVVL